MSGPFPLSQVMLAGSAGTGAASAALEEALGRVVDAARRAWPGGWLSGEAFVAYLAQRLPDGDDLVAALSELRTDDLYLCAACVAGVDEAVAQFDRRYLGHLPVIYRVDPSPAFADEVQQVLREKLLVRPAGGGAPKLAEYRGRGDLQGWLRTVALRVALNLRRGPVAEELDEARPGASGQGPGPGQIPAPDPEVDYLRARYQKEFAESFQEALRALSAEERSVLRMYFLDGLSGGKIADLLDISRATVSRWLASLREQILLSTQRRLGERLHLQPAEFESLAGVLHSQLDVSITGCLRGG